MKEIEILVEVLDAKEHAIEILNKYQFNGIKETIDTYYYDPLRSNLKPDSNMQLNECLRLRSKADQNYITYKTDNFDDNNRWIYSDEYETKVESLEVLEKIIKKLGLELLVVINNKKWTYTYNDYEIVLEEVKDLGLFLEVELESETDDKEVLNVKNKIQEFINNLNLKVSAELNTGKPELMIKKNLNK